MIFGALRMGEPNEVPQEVQVQVPNTPVPPSPAVGRFHVILLFTLPAVLMGIAWVMGPWLYSMLRQDSAPVVSTRPVDGHALFIQNCAYCHGEQGDGKGVAGLNPPARYFGKEAFRFISTTNGVPSDADLMRTLTHGLPGSAMPAFDTLSEENRKTLIDHVRSLIITGIYERERQKTDPFDFYADEAWKTATLQAEVGPTVEIPVIAHMPSAKTLEEGRQIFLQSCANCHGKEGRGDGEQTKDPKFVTDNGARAVPRDLTQGIFKAGRDREQLYIRIRLGIPGTPMPATPQATLTPEQVHSLIDYVISLSEARVASKPSPAEAVAAK
jgi:cytochrome c oxidase cbb3-type subunit I/II